MCVETQMDCGSDPGEDVAQKPDGEVCTYAGGPPVLLTSGGGASLLGSS